MNNAITVPKIYVCEIKIWSAIGHTPITGRAGAYCDELLSQNLNVLDPTDARVQVLKLLHDTPHARQAYFNMPQFPNQNTRSQWIVR